MFTMIGIGKEMQRTPQIAQTLKKRGTVLFSSSYQLSKLNIGRREFARIIINTNNVIIRLVSVKNTMIVIPLIIFNSMMIIPLL